MATALVIIVAFAALLALLLRELSRYWQRSVLGVLAAQLVAYRRGDYEGLMRAGERLRVRLPEAYLFSRGAGLFKLGRLQEAEVCIRQSLAMRKNQRLRSTDKGLLGQVLLEQQRYAEAIACFESCVADWPQDGDGHRGIAETLLRQGVQPAEALRRARLAADLSERNMEAGAEARDHSLGEALATLAWAEAVNAGTPAKVEHWLEKAFPLCPETIVPIRAELHYLAGRAYAALGKSDESAREFQRAASLDPKGNYGRLAKAAMP